MGERRLTMRQRRLFLAPYACSGFAGLVDELAWTRLLTLHMGHGTAATSTVVAAFMGGLAAGSVLGGWMAPRVPPHRTLYRYVALEVIVVFVALVLLSLAIDGKVDASNSRTCSRKRLSPICLSSFTRPLVTC